MRGVIGHRVTSGDKSPSEKVVELSDIEKSRKYVEYRLAHMSSH